MLNDIYPICGQSLIPIFELMNLNACYICLMWVQSSQLVNIDTYTPIYSGNDTVSRQTTHTYYSGLLDYTNRHTSSTPRLAYTYQHTYGLALLAPTHADLLAHLVYAQTHILHTPYSSGLSLLSGGGRILRKPVLLEIRAWSVYFPVIKNSILAESLLYFVIQKQIALKINTQC